MEMITGAQSCEDGNPPPCVFFGMAEYTAEEQLRGLLFPQTSQIPSQRDAQPKDWL